MILAGTKYTSIVNTLNYMFASTQGQLNVRSANCNMNRAESRHFADLKVRTALGVPVQIFM